MSTKDFVSERKKAFDKLIDEDRREVEFSSGNSSLAISKSIINLIFAPANLKTSFFSFINV